MTIKKILAKNKHKFYKALMMLGLLIVITNAFATPLNFTFKGINPEMSDNAKAFLEKDLSDQTQNHSDKNVMQFINHSPKTVKKALAPFGYFQPTIHFTIDRTKKPWQVNYQIQTGPSLKISKLHVEVIGPGKTDKKILEQVRQLSLKTQQTFSTVQYEAAKENLLTNIQEQGFIYAYFEIKTVTIDLKKSTCNIEWQINTGRKYYFGAIQYDTLPYNDRLLHSFLQFPQGQPFSAKKLLLQQQALEKSVYFDTVTLTPLFKEAKNDIVPIRFSASVPKAKSYLFGVGYGTLTGFRFTAATNIRRLNEAGHHLNSKLQYSSVLSSLSSKYIVPGKNPLVDQYTLGANAQLFTPKNGNSKSATLSLGYDHSKKDWQTHLSLNGLTEHYAIEGETSYTSNLLYPAFNFTYTKFDDLINPTYGKSLSVTLQGTNTALFSRSNFLQGELKGKFLWSPTQYSHLVFRGDVGYTVVDNLNQLPLTLRFFAGGINSVRGYPDSSLGPGKYLTVGSIEFQHRVYKEWDAAVFYDMGSASNHFAEQFNRSVGVGIIYNSVIGPIRVYVAQARDLRKRPFHLELSVGPDL